MRAEFKAARAKLAAHLDKQATRFAAAVRFQASASTVQPQTIQKSLPARLHARLSLPARTPARLPVSAASVPAAATPGTGLHWIACTHLHPRCLTLPPSAHALCCACRAWQSCLPAVVRRMRSTRKRLSSMQPARCVNACSAACVVGPCIVHCCLHSICSVCAVSADCLRPYALRTQIIYSCSLLLPSVFPPLPILSAYLYAMLALLADVYGSVVLWLHCLSTRPG